MSKKSYRDILTRYIQEHKVEDAILTDQVVQYAAEELGKDAAEVKKAVNVTMARLEKDGYVIRLAKGVYCKKVRHLVFICQTKMICFAGSCCRTRTR